MDCGLFILLLFSNLLIDCKALTEEAQAPEEGKATRWKEPGSLSEYVEQISYLLGEPRQTVMNVKNNLLF